MRTDLGIEGQRAPAWEVTHWFNVEAGQPLPEPVSLSGNVIYRYGFQSWCSGCHHAGFPNLLETRRRLGEDPDIKFVAVQTVFEGFDTNDAAAAENVVQRYGLELPVGHDPGLCVAIA